MFVGENSTLLARRASLGLYNSLLKSCTIKLFKLRRYKNQRCEFSAANEFSVNCQKPATRRIMWMRTVTWVSFFYSTPLLCDVWEREWGGRAESIQKSSSWKHLQAWVGEPKPRTLSNPIIALLSRFRRGSPAYERYFARLDIITMLFDPVDQAALTRGEKSTQIATKPKLVWVTIPSQRVAN